MTPTAFHSELESRLIRYAAIDSQSDEHAATIPSTAIQLNLARLLVAELQEIGASDVRLTDYGTVLATLPATSAGPTLGFLAHMTPRRSSMPLASSRASSAAITAARSCIPTTLTCPSPPKIFPIWRKRSAMTSSPLQA